MQKTPSTKIKKKLKNISHLKKSLKKWCTLPEEEVFELVKRFEKIPRDEVSTYFYEILKDDDLAVVLLIIGKKFEDNIKLHVYIVSSLGNLMERYGLEETQDIYVYFLANSQRKSVSAYVSLFFTSMKGFASYPDKWAYIMSVKDMKPAKVGKSSFETIVKKEENTIPNKHKNVVFEYFLEKASKANSESGKKYYEDCADRFR